MGRRRRIAVVSGALVVVAGVVGAAVALAASGPTARERSRAATERPCGRAYVELEATPIAAPRFGLARVGRADQPTALAVDPRGERPTLLGEREGRILVVDADGDITDEVALDLGDTSDYGDGGLLGVVYDPDDPWVYAYRTTAEQDDVVSAHRLGADGRPTGEAAVEVLRSGHPESEQHHGGAFGFGPDGMLYVGLGDGGGLGDPEGNAQRGDTVLGKLLRIDPTPGDDEPYRVPPDNPHVGDDGWRPEIWARGLRNPFRLSFDEMTGDLWLGDVGQSCWEELNRLTAADAGADLGWDRFEGSAPFEGGDLDDARWPELAYGHRGGWCALVLGPVVRQPALPDLDGWLLYTDFCAGRIHGFRPGDGAAGGEQPAVLDTGLRVERPVAIAEGPDGLPWVLSLDGDVWRIVPRDR